MNVCNASTAVLSLLGFAATAHAAVEVILCSEPSFGNCVTYNVNTGGCGKYPKHAQVLIFP